MSLLLHFTTIGYNYMYIQFPLFALIHLTCLLSMLEANVQCVNGGMPTLFNQKMALKN